MGREAPRYGPPSYPIYGVMSRILLTSSQDNMSQVRLVT